MNKIVLNVDMNRLEEKVLALIEGHSVALREYYMFKYGTMDKEERSKLVKSKSVADDCKSIW